MGERDDPSYNENKMPDLIERHEVVAPNGPYPLGTVVETYDDEMQVVTLPEVETVEALPEPPPPPTSSPSAAKASPR